MSLGVSSCNFSTFKTFLTLTCRDKSVVTCKLCLITRGSVTCKIAVTVRLSLNFIIGCWVLHLIEGAELVERRV
jgi:hypothetical protein